MWHTAALQRAKRLPKFEKFVSSRKQKPQTARQIRQIIMMHHVLHRGVDLKKEKK